MIKLQNEEWLVKTDSILEGIFKCINSSTHLWSIFYEIMDSEWKLLLKIKVQLVAVLISVNKIINKFVRRIIKSLLVRHHTKV